MSYTYLLEAGAESSAACFSGIPACVLWRLNLDAAKICSTDNGTASSLNSPSGMTSKHSTQNHGAGTLTSLPADSRVRTSAQLEKALVLEGAEVGSGNIWRESRLKPIRRGSSWKIRRSSGVEALPLSSVTLPSWGMIRRGRLLERITSVRLIGVTECGFWATPLASDWKSGKGGIPRKRQGSHPLRQQILWATPCAADAKGSTGGAQGRSLRTDVRIWPTPCAMEPEKDIKKHLEKLSKPRSERGGGCGPNLATAVKKFPTPTRSMATMGDMNQARHCSKMRPPYNSVNGGSLNPDWVEWLMGWPVGLTASEPLAMDKFQEWLRQHSFSSKTNY